MYNLLAPDIKTRFFIMSTIQITLVKRPKLFRNRWK